MGLAAEDLLEQALALPSADRVRLASDLLASLDGAPVDEDEVERSWSRETDRRMELLGSGEALTVSRDEVRDGLAALRARRSG